MCSLNFRMAVTHVIFDFDGLLVDTEACYTKANEAILEKYGRKFTQELNSSLFLAHTLDDYLAMKVNLADKITLSEYLTQYDTILAEMFLKCKAMPGAERLVRHFHKKGIPQAICSGSRGSTFGPRREPHKEWLDLIPLKVFCGDEPDIKRGKPYPDPYLAAMNKRVVNYVYLFPAMPSDPSKVLVFEDSPNGGRSAKAAGMKCVMVPNEKFRKEALEIGVTQVLDSLLEFRPEEYGLPPFD
ncbi:unnamed protein product [Angiostrongylus costaricensis]|uniref:HAD hydrolase, family IA, variant 3 n=1 Tax=Angiostrongylus costaricensis TaxID=334426 RepID=A0A0R3PHS5_ANGCS|nr:unnamed protein product [Angiostrongylus costaricensis]